MAFDTVSALVSERYTEVRRVLTHLSAFERPRGSTEPETPIVHTLRGLFVVNLYGAWEFSVTRSLIQLYAIINSTGIEHRHLAHAVGSIALDSLFKSLSDTGNRRTWTKRMELLQRQMCDDSVRIDDSVFMADLQSLKYKVLEQIFRALDIGALPVPKNSYRGLIDDVAERRSAVAHGRLSPADVGSQYGSAELGRRIDALSETSFYIIGEFEKHLNSKRIIRSAYRKRYGTAP